MEHLMLVSIGPVQGFIRTARRTRDLWYGSWLLSELSKVAAATLSRHGELIFPAISDPHELTYRSELNVVNRVLATVEGDPKAIAKEIQGNLDWLLRDQWQDTKLRLRGKLDTEEDAVAQILDLVELQWASVPLGGDYRQARAQVEELLAARKNSRDFRPPPWSSAKPKSSLDGVRESVIPESAYPTFRGAAESEAERQERLQQSAALYYNYGAGPAERLSGVDLLKRHGNFEQAERVPSTSHLAAGPFLRYLKRDPARQAQALALVAKLEKKGLHLQRIHFSGQPDATDAGVVNDYDASLLYENRLRELLEELGLAAEQGEKLEQEVLGLLKTFYEGLVRAAPKPSPYYALMLADGDNMGKVLDKLASIEIHRQMSATLSAFARDVRNIVADHHGFLIYSGGDDVLAFLPLDTVWECAQTLSNKFRERLKSYRNEEEGIAPTLSMGIVIAHQLEPLTDVLTLAHEAEQAAKSLPGKDAVAVILSKRSGPDRVIAGRWTDGIGERMAYLMTHLAHQIPEGVAHELLYLHRQLADLRYATKEERTGQARTGNGENTGEKPGVDAVLPEVLRLEAGRILQRKRAERGARPISEEVLNTLDGWLRADAASPSKRQYTAEQLGQELILAKVLAEARQMAGTSPTIKTSKETPATASETLSHPGSSQEAQP